MNGARRVYRGIDRLLRRIPPRRYVKTWLWASKLGQGPVGDLWVDRPERVKQLARGKSFADVGGMFDHHGRVAFLAEEAGAKEVVVFDGLEPSETFQAEHAQRQSNVRYVQGDLHDAEGIRRLGTFDVVWCAGILYHTPDPLRQLEHLRRMTTETLMLGTHVIPELPGFEGGCLLYPAFSDAVRREFADLHGPDAERYWGIGQPFLYAEGEAYPNFWWGISRSALRAMMRVSGFDIVEEHDYGEFFIDMVCRRSDRPSILPHDDEYRRRGEERVESFAGALPAWARQPSA